MTTDSLLASATEAELLTAVIDMAHLFGWKVAHFRPAQTSRGWRTAVQGDGVGWPDLELVRPPRFLIVELKRQKGVLSADQAGWLDLLRLCPGVETYVWRPLDMDVIERLLR